MFQFQLPGGSFTNSYYKDNQLKFDPPVFEQRYAIALRILEHPNWEGQIKKVVDFGASEMKFLPLIKQNEEIEHVLEVDIDEDVLKKNMERAQPFLTDYIRNRANPFTVDVYKGSIDEPDEVLTGIDAVIGIEIIEHVYPDTLNNLPYSIFGYVQPKLVIFSTPNSDINVLFHLELPNGFRHYDHKFEWSREQFKDWCLNICERFPNFKVGFTGAGEPPLEHKNLGVVSQFAIFVRLDILGHELVSPLDTFENHPDVPVKSYKLLHNQEYPFKRDERTKETKIYDEAIFHINRLRRVDMYKDQEKNLAQIPVIAVLKFVEPLTQSSTELVNILKANNIKVEYESIIVETEEEDEFNWKYKSFDSLNEFYPYDDSEKESDDQTNQPESNKEIDEESWD